MASQQQTVHAAASPECCRAMARKYGWELVRIRKAKGDDSILPVDSIFKGNADFPNYQDKDDG
ncbi:MAG: hypothetical protein ACFB0C_14695 [Leptolyngbyaceae cyanobacterium]